MNIQQMIDRKNELGLTYEQIANLTGVPIGTVQKVLGGITKAPRYDTLLALDELLGEHPTIDVLEESSPAYNSYSRTEENSSYCLNDTGAAYDASGSYEYDETAEAASNAALAAKIRSYKNPGEFTIKDYYALPDDQRVELIDGVFYDMESPYTTHQIVAFGIAHQIKRFVESNKGPCMPMMSPVDVQLDMDDKTMIQPDVLIVCDKDKIVKRKVYGAPDFIVEVLSKSTKKKDMTIKLTKYEKAGVREYWMVDIEKQKIMAYNFENGFDVTIYGFADEVPISIYDGKCKVNFKPIFEDVEFLL